jgi:hypothetical protein
VQFRGPQKPLRFFVIQQVLGKHLASIWPSVLLANAAPKARQAMKYFPYPLANGPAMRKARQGGTQGVRHAYYIEIVLSLECGFLSALF